MCAQLGISLIHARPYHAAAKGKQERFFRTARQQLLRRLAPEDTASLEALNRRLWAYIEGEYHQAPHRGLGGETPLDRWARSADAVRYVAPDVDLDALFLFEARRKVHKDRTVSLNGRVFELDAALVGEVVTLRFDPERPDRPPHVHHRGRRVETARVLDAYANCFVRRHRASATLAAEPAADAPRDSTPPAPTAEPLRLTALAEAANDPEEER